MNPVEAAMLDFIESRLASGDILVPEKDILNAVAPSRKDRQKPAVRYGLGRLHRRHLINYLPDRDGRRYYYIGNAPTQAMWEYVGR